MTTHFPPLIDKPTSAAESAFAATPQRFVAGVPIPPKLPTQVWINEPKEVAR